MMKPRKVGTFEGQDVCAYELANSAGMHATLFNWGAVLQSLTLPLADGPRNVVLGFDAFEDYPAQSPYFGATVGRYGNRIGGGQYTHKGQSHQLDLNQKGLHHLHGGAAGLGRRIWSAEPHENGRAITFHITSEDGDQGYPGRFEATCLYELTETNTLDITMSATCDQTCPVNLVHHSYWNLDGGGMIDTHRLHIPASHFVEVDNALIPTGNKPSVEGRKLDFRTKKVLNRDGLPIFDHAMCLDRNGDRPELAAKLTSGDQHVSMSLISNQPCVQFYTGFKLNLTSSTGQIIGPRSGLCLETEIEPDAVNHPTFTSPWLEPGDTYHHTMRHEFTWS